MQRNGEDARLSEFPDFPFKRSDRLFYSQFHFWRGMLFDRVDDAVVEIEPVGHRDHVAKLRLERDRNVVDDPLANVLDSSRSQMIERIECLRPARAHPAARPLAGERLKLLYRFDNELVFVGFSPEAALMDPVTDEFPTAVTYRAGERRIYIQDARVDAGANRDLAVIEKF